jgi:hypothetical protein
MRETEPTCSESRNKLGQCNKKEIEVEEEFELLVKHDGQEREHIVLLVADDVWGELVLSFVFLEMRERCFIEEYTGGERTWRSQGHRSRLVF